MPYFVTDDSECPSWAVVKDDGEVIACHDSKESAVDQMVAISLEEGIEPGGELRDDSLTPAIVLDIDNTIIRGGGLNQRLIDWLDTFGDDQRIIITARPESNRQETEADLEGFSYDLLVMKQTDDPTPEYKRNEAQKLQATYNIMVAVDDSNAVLRAYRSIGITAIHPNEVPDTPDAREVNLTPPAYMRAAARQGLKFYEEGKGGDGLVERTIREARAMAEGNVSADKWVRIAAWIARHLGDLDAPAANPNNDSYPSPGVVAHLLWGSGPSKRAANRALEYAQGVVDRLEEENEGRTKGEALSKLETRVFDETFEIREDDEGGMRLEGYAALFNSRSQNLGGFTEVIEPGAFSRSLKSRNDVKLLWNHESGAVLGSTRAGTLTLVEDERGLKVSALLPNTTYGRDARELISRGDVTGFSFGFSMPARGGDEWSSDGTERVLKSVRLHEVSLTPFPAYTATNGTATVRGLDKVAERAQVDADQLADALLKVEAGEEISIEEKSLISKVIDTLAPIPEVAPEVNLDSLNLKKTKLALLEKGLI
jgi:uncharacterized protein